MYFIFFSLSKGKYVEKALYLTIEIMALFFSLKSLTHLKQMVKLLGPLDPLRVAADEQPLVFD